MYQLTRSNDDKDSLWKW